MTTVSSVASRDDCVPVIDFNGIVSRFRRRCKYPNAIAYYQYMQSHYLGFMGLDNINIYLRIRITKAQSVRIDGFQNRRLIYV